MRTPLVPVVVLATFLLGCSSPGPTPIDPDRLLRMAGEEAGQIASPRERLTRQFNIANRETQAGRATDARQTLRAARDTLEHADAAALDDQSRLAGWVSLAELSRDADDKPFANAALDQALAALDQVTPHPARCPYVLGVEHELRALRGNEPAIKLLTDAAQWALEIPVPATRRGTFVAFAEELFRCDAYDAARDVLRLDPDPAWRSDALVTLADRARWTPPSSFPFSPSAPLATYAAKSGSASELASPPADSASTQPVFKSLDFRSNFYRP